MALSVSGWVLALPPAHLPRSEEALPGLLVLEGAGAERRAQGRSASAGANTADIQTPNSTGTAREGDLVQLIPSASAL